MTRIAFLDTETTGLSLDDHIWEFAAIVREDDGTERTHQFFIDHDREKAKKLPEQFYADYTKRYDPLGAMSQHWATFEIAEILSDKIHVVGAVPNFDTERIALLLQRHGFEPGWHYHLIDVENLAVGYLHGRLREAERFFDSGDETRIGDRRALLPALPWDSEDLSRAVDVDPEQFNRHTALGDAEWARAIYDAVMGGPR